MTFERLFRLAIADDLFRDAEAAAGKVVELGTPSPTTNALAHLVKIIAEADRGAFDQSLQSLRQAVCREHINTTGDRRSRGTRPRRGYRNLRSVLSAPGRSKSVSDRA